MALGAGIAKELADLSGLGDPSWRDLTWDAIGTATALAVSWSSDLLIRGVSWEHPLFMAPMVNGGGVGCVRRWRSDPAILDHGRRSAPRKPMGNGCWRRGCSGAAVAFARYPAMISRMTIHARSTVGTPRIRSLANLAGLACLFGCLFLAACGSSDSSPRSTTEPPAEGGPSTLPPGGDGGADAAPPLSMKAGLGPGFSHSGPWTSFYGKASEMGDLAKVASTFRIINIDVDPTENNFSDAQIQQLKAGGKNTVISYMNVGSCEETAPTTRRARPSNCPVWRNC